MAIITAMNMVTGHVSVPGTDIEHGYERPA